MHPPLYPNYLENSELVILIDDIIRAIPGVCSIVKLFSNFIKSTSKDAYIRKIDPNVFTWLYVKELI